MDRLPDELIRHISDYGGIYTAKNIADTSRTLANVYNVPGLVEGIEEHRASMEECKMYRDTLRQVDHVMQMMQYILFEQGQDITPRDAMDILENYDPMWFSLGDVMQEKAQEYMDTLAYSDWVFTNQYGPNTHAYTRAKACSDLLGLMGFVLANFNSWIQADLHSRDTTGFRRYMMKRMEGFMPELQTLYNTVKDLLDRCIEARPETTLRKIYSFGRKSRRPTKGKKHRYAIHDSRNKGLDTLPDEALRLISDYGGLYTAKSMADTSRKLANIYNIPGLVDEIQTHRTSMEECNMYKDTLRQVDHVMHMMYSIMNQPNITPDEVTDILVNYDPMWFSLAETMYRKAQEYNTFAYTNELPMDYYGPSTHAYERARACADLLNSVGSFMSRFNSWITIGNNSRQTARLRARQLKELELHLPEIGAFYDKVESLLNMCMESRPAPTTSRNIYNFGMKGRRPRKGRKLRYAIEREDDEKNDIDQFTDWITGVLFDQLMDNDNGYIENIDENVYDKLVNADEQEDIPKRWTAVTNRDICIGNPFSFYGTLNKAIVELDKHLKRCADNPNELGTFDYWINRLKTPTAIRGLIYSNMRPVVASGASLDDMYTYADEKFTMESITNMLYEMIRHLYTTEDLIRLV